MICPDPAYRITAMQAYHHPSLQPTDSNIVLTPHFVRAAAEYISPPLVPDGTTAINDERKRRAKKTDKSNKENRAPTPALGESIRQHTSMPMLRAEAKKDKGKQKEGKIPSPRKKSIVIKSNQKLLERSVRGQDEDPTRELLRLSPSPR
jgi:protein-serine/threonine kinase